MGWFLGCFGRGSKDRKLSKPQKASHPLPARSFPASPSIPIKVPAREGSIREGLFTTRQELCGSSRSNTKNNGDFRLLSSTAPARSAQGILFRGPAGVAPGKFAADSMPEKQQADPWSQLDVLEEELEDLRRQIDQEAGDAKKIRDEVTLLKSSGTLLHSPPESNKRNQNPSAQNMTEKNHTNWHSWILPSSSPKASKVQPEQKREREELIASSCAPTYAKERECVSHGVQTPTLKGLSRRTFMNSSLQTLPQSVVKDANSGVTQEQKIGRDMDASRKLRLDDQELNHTQRDWLQQVPNRYSNKQTGLIMPKVTAGDTRPMPVPKNNKAHASDNIISITETESNLPSISTSATPGNSTLSPASGAKSLSFISAYYGNFTTQKASCEDSVAKGESERSYCNGSSFEVDEESSVDASATHSYEESCLGTSASESYSSKASEESGSEMFPQRCFSPPMSPTLKGRSICKHEESFEGQSASSTQARQHSHVSSQYSIYGGWKRGSDVGEDKTEGSQDNESFSDALEHISTVSSELGSGRHVHTNSMDSFSMHLGHMAQPNSLVEVSSSRLTPVAGKQSRIRSKPASPVLTPVENLSRWHQLKGRHDNPDESSTLSKIRQSNKIDIKSSVPRQMDNLRNSTWDDTKQGQRSAPPRQMDNLRNSTWDDTKQGQRSAPKWHPNPRKEAHNAEVADIDSIRVDTSLSHWLKPSSQREANQLNGSKYGAGSNTESQNRNPFASMPGQYSLAGTANKLQGAAGPYFEHSAKRPRWDGKGMPDCTTKDKEDQKVGYQFK